MEPTSVGIREAKVHLSRIVRQVKNGHEVVLTDRGRPVCRIVPIEPGSLSFEERIQRLEEQGVIARLSEGTVKKIPFPIPLREDLAQKYLQEDRDGAI